MGDHARMDDDGATPRPNAWRVYSSFSPNPGNPLPRYPGSADFVWAAPGDPDPADLADAVADFAESHGVRERRRSARDAMVTVWFEPVPQVAE